MADDNSTQWSLSLMGIKCKYRDTCLDICLPSSQSVQSRDVFMVGVASERSSMKKISESPKALL